jgi:hypothetical protein
MAHAKSKNLIEKYYPSPKFRKHLVLGIKIFVATAAIVFLADALANKRLERISFPAKWDFYHYYVLSLFFFFASINFFLDVLLWLRISVSAKKVEWHKAAFHHLRSITLGFITPYNVGEFGGKIRQYKEPTEQIKAVYLTYIFRYVKMSARNLIGSLALLWLVVTEKFLGIDNWQAIVIFTLAIGIVLLYFKMERIVPLISGLVVLGRKYFSPLARITMKPGKKFVWLIYGSLKFLVYPSQFVLALVFFDSTLNFSLNLLMLSLVYYSVAAFLPSAQVIDPVVKSAAGVFVLSGSVAYPESIVVATTAVWAANVAMPAFFGALFFFFDRKI